MKHSSIIDRTGSTLGVMDDLQIAVHSYDGCARGCPGCIVDKHFKNHGRFEPILKGDDLQLINRRVLEYSDWVQKTLNYKEGGYFGKNGYQVQHHSYTFRFGNHAELPVDELIALGGMLHTDYRVFSVAPPTNEEIEKFATMKSILGGSVFLEIIYDPFADSPEAIRDAVLAMRESGLNGYPELLLTKRLIRDYPAERFLDECVSIFGDIGAQIQFGRYSPSRTRNFNKTQMATVDEEAEWLAVLAKGIVARGHDIHPIPLGEYAVTLLDEYREIEAVGEDGYVDPARLREPDPFLVESVREKTRDIFLTSLYIDHNLDVFVWSESMGQHVLDSNFGYAPLGNLRQNSIIDMATEKSGALDRMLNEVIRELLTNRKCAPCRYKSFCASHAVPLFRRFNKDDGEHCYGYLPVIREYQRDLSFLNNMVEGFRELGF